MIRSSSLPTWTTPLLLVACATDLFAQRPPYDVFPPADPPYYRVRYEAGARQASLSIRSTTPSGSPRACHRCAASSFINTVVGKDRASRD